MHTPRPKRENSEKRFSAPRPKRDHTEKRFSAPRPKRDNTEKHFKAPRENSDTSWEPVQTWYQKIVGSEGHYYHRQVILPHLKKWLKGATGVLDLACGNGILTAILPPDCNYLGIDLSPSLIKSAKARKNEFMVGDITKPLNLGKQFSHAVVLLALQNLEHPQKALENAYKHLEDQGELLIVLNHPCFRIPRQTAWGVEKERKIQYRRVDRYMSSMQIPILAHPGKGENSEKSLTFHIPLSTLSKQLFEKGFVIELIEEWCSDKLSEGGAAKMENRSRDEIPLFMALKCRKQSK